MGSEGVSFQPPTSVNDFFSKLSKRQIKGNVTFTFLNVTNADKAKLLAAQGLYNAGAKDKAFNAINGISPDAQIEIAIGNIKVSASIKTLMPSETPITESKEDRIARQYVENVMGQVVPSLIAKPSGTPVAIVIN